MTTSKVEELNKKIRDIWWDFNKDCDFCDGIGFVSDPTSTSGSKDCPKCKGMGSTSFEKFSQAILSLLSQSKEEMVKEFIEDLHDVEITPNLNMTLQRLSKKYRRHFKLLESEK